MPLLVLLLTAGIAAAQTARVQVLHNSASPTVDIYANGALILDDFAYRSATPFLDLPAQTLIQLAVAPANSQSAADALVTFPVVFDAGKTYIVSANGIVGDPTTPFTLLVNDLAKEVSDDPAKVEIAVMHGATNAPSVDVDATFLAGAVISNLSYNEFTPYLSLNPDKYDFSIRPTGSPNAVASFRADLSGLAGKAAWVFASGLLGGDPAFGLFALLPDGTVLELSTTPTARVQVIHNSPSPVVDIYAGNTLIINDFEYRTATPFVSLPADRNINIGIAPDNSTSAADAIATFPVTLGANNAYAVFASGIVGDTLTPFNLLVDAAREASSDTSTVEFATLHGSTNAPAVDVAVYGAGNIITDLSYGEFAPYLGVAPGVYTLLLKPAGSNDAVAAFEADLSGLAGGAARVFASGIFGGTPAFGLFAVLPDGTVVEFPQVAIPGTARLQVVHNSASPTVDIYVNDDLFIDDFAYRTATPFVDVPSNVALNIGVALSNSQSSDDVLVSFPVTLETGKTYIATASGIVGSPVTPFGLVINDAAREAASDPAKVDIAVLHGSTNAPAVDVDAIFVADDVIDNLAYGSFTPYLSLDAGVYDLAIRAHDDPNVVASYRADLTGLDGAAAWVFASGVLGGNPAFGLFAALPNGTVIELPLTPVARVQIIHNSPSPTVDVYAGNTRLINDFAFRTATPFVTVPANRDIVLGIAPDNSNSAADAIATFNANFAEGSAYTAIAAGVVGGAPAFDLFVDGNALETAPAGLTAFSVFHGSPDAPGVDVYERLIGKLIDDATFGEFTPYLSVAPELYFIDLKVTGDDNIVATFAADLSGLDGIPARVFASGYLGGLPGFGLFAALPDGTVVELPATQVARVQIIHNSPEPTVDVYAFSDLILDDFAFRTATPYIYVPAGFPIDFGVAPGNSQSPNDIIATFPATFDNGKTYVVVASGILGNAVTPFELLVNDNGRERPEDDTKLELSVHHGAPDAPAVDVSPYNSGFALLSGLEYRDFTPYLTLDPNVYLLEVAPTAAPGQIVGIWGGDFTPLPGLVGVVFASGLLNGEPGFDLWLALPDGFTLPLPSFARAQVIHNAPAPTVDAYFDDQLVIDNFGFRQATGIGLFPANVPFTLSVAPGNSQSVDDAIYNLPVSSLSTRKMYIIMASGVVGGAPGFELVINENGRDRAQDPGQVDLTLYHGSPDAPEVDVKLFNGPVLFDNIEYGEFSDYLSVPGDEYQIQITPANDNNTIVQSYTADISTLTGQAATVFASGFLGGNTPGFEVWVALTNGVTFPLPVFVKTNELDTKLSEVSMSPNPATERVTLAFDLNDSEALRYRVRDVSGRMVLEGDFGTLDNGTFARDIDVSYLSSGMYLLEILSDTGLKAVKFAVQR